MNTIKFDNKENIKMIAHRGISGIECENTCPAFVAAGLKSYYGIETDVQVTLDGKFIIVHDSDLKRIAGLDIGVMTSNFDDLRAIRFSSIDGTVPRTGLYLPSLEEYLSICKKYGKEAYLEICAISLYDHVIGIASTVEQMGMMDSTTFISFNHSNLTDLRSSYPHAKAQLLTGDIGKDNIAFILENNIDAGIYYPNLTKEFVDLMHANGRIVNVWTVDTLEDAERMRDMGVDVITSNILE